MSEFRCYKNKQKNTTGGGGNGDDSEEKNDPWRFETYERHVKIKHPLANGQLKSGQCGLYCCYDTHTDKNGHVNQQTTFYMLYSN
jgi:hypothetical protein